MRVSILATVVATLTFTAFSCQKEDSTQPTSPLTEQLTFAGVEVSFSNNLMHIASGADALHIDREFPYAKTLREAVNSQATFISSGELFDELTEDHFIAEGTGKVPDQFRHVAYLATIKGEQFVDPVNEEPILMELANTKGQLAIGDRLLTVRPDRMVLIPLKDLAEFGANPESHPQAEIRWDKKRIIQMNSIGEKVDIGDCSAEFGNSGRGRRRVRGFIEENEGLRGIFDNTPNLNVRAKTKFSRKGTFGIWYGEEADRLRQTGVLAFSSNSGEFVDDEDSGISSLNYLFNSEGPVIRFTQGIRHTAADAGMINSDCFSRPVN